MALVIAGIQLVGLFASVDENSCVGGALLSLLSANMNALGCGIVVFLIAIWLVAIAANRFGAPLSGKSPTMVSNPHQS